MSPSNNLHTRFLDEATGSEEELLRMIREGEHQTQDFKFQIDSSRKIAKTICAFANTDGGRLLIGVKDNGSVRGIDAEEEYFMIEGAAKQYCRPAIHFSATVFPFENEQNVLIIEIDKSIERPHHAQDEDGKWRTFVRQEDENFVANRVLYRFLKNQHQTSKENVLAYRQEEKLLLEFLEENSDISLSKFSKIAKLPIYKAERTLALFLQWEIIDWKASENGVRFHLL